MKSGLNGIVYLFVLICFLPLPISLFAAECSPGEIIKSCTCGENDYEVGLCCENVWFDPYYSKCPTRIFYVDQDNESANDSNDGSLESPWETIGKASSTLVAGDAVLVKAGTYSEPGEGINGYTTPAMNPDNSGTSEDPIIFKSYPGDAVNIINDGYGPLIGVNGRDYIVWDGFNVLEGTSYYANNIYNTGSVVLWGTTGSVVKSCVIEGSDVRTQDNHNGIRAEYADNVLIRNNIIRNVTGDFYNSNGIQMFRVDDSVIENNEIYGNSSGIYLKDNIDNVAVRYNIIRDNYWSGIVTASQKDIANPNGESFGFYIYQNLIKGNASINEDRSLITAGISVSGYSHDVEIFNNVFDGNHKDITNEFGSDSPDWESWNNIFYNSTAHHYYIASTTDISYLTYSDYNNFYNTLVWFDSGTYSGISSWQSHSSYDNNSKTVNPLFVAPETNDYHLNTGSECINTGIDRQDYDTDENTTENINMGLYITGDEVIGLDPLGAPSPGPLPGPGHEADDDESNFEVSGGCGFIIQHQNAKSSQYLTSFLALILIGSLLAYRRSIRLYASECQRI